MENSVETPQKFKNRTTIRPSNSTSAYLSEENENSNLKRYMCLSVHCSIFIIAKILKQTKCPSIEKCLKKMRCVCVCDVMLPNHKKELNFAICNNMDGPRSYYIEWRKSDKDWYHMISLLYGILKKKKTKKNKQINSWYRDQTDSCQKGREVEGWARKVKGNKKYKLLVIK